MDDLNGAEQPLCTIPGLNACVQEKPVAFPRMSAVRGQVPLAAVLHLRFTPDMFVE
jgi:hypothetical protein